jgi:ribonuclease HI
LLKFGEHEREVSGAELQTTNNRMELTAVIRALEALKRPVKGRIYTDSQYVRQGILEWMPNWKRRGWKTADKKPVKNQDLWEALDALARTHDLEWHWVKGHSGNEGNERVDALANRAIDALVG